MDSERWQRVAYVYESALEREPAERSAFVKEASGDDDALRREVESLLANDSASLLIDRPMLEAAAAVLVDEETALSIGQQFGPYRIDRFLGAGGMGQVYRATDTRLNRPVAIKVLPPTLATDAQFRARFDREAKAIAGLSHPHICTLHDVGRQEGVDFLVMEYLDGETLAARLEKGPLTLTQVLHYGIEIADALVTAHRHGIIHRDLKPSNVALTKGGGAKLLDFGLAKPVASVISGSSSVMPPPPPEVTAQGTILGTLQYMAPEQLEGKQADARTDIFAFGAIVYEMLTGRKAFEGKSQASLVGAIMNAEPPAIMTFQPLTPRALDRIVKTCLAKDPDDRWQTARDLWRELQWIAHDPIATADTGQPSAARSAPFLAVAAMVIAALASYATWMLKPARSRPDAVTRFSFTLPEDLRFTRPNRRLVAISPDGSRIVLVANSQLYLRDLADEKLQLIPGTDLDVGSPFFSPDGRWVAFWGSAGGSAAGTLRKIGVTGGAPVVVGETAEPFGASWGADNQILIGGGRYGIQRVSAEGGRPEVIIKVNSGEFAANPQMLPDGENVLFTLGEQGHELDPTRQRNWDQARIVVQSLKTGDRRVLINGGSDARYAPTGHIVYARGSTLWARPFDQATLEVTGEPASIVEGVRTEGSGRFTSGAAHFSFSGDGNLAYVTGRPREPPPSRSVALIDLDGRVKPLDLPPGRYHSPRFSLPDGGQIVLSTDDGVIWIFDLDGKKPMRRLTLDAGHLLALWTRDGHVVFRSTLVDGQAGIFRQRADGSAVAERLTEPGLRSYFPYSVSADGKTLLLLTDRSVQPGELGQGIATLSLTGDRTPKTLFQGAKGEVMFSPTLSPDGRWLAYEWRRENKNNIYVDPFPLSGIHRQITTDGGSNPMWSPDGKRLFYLRGSGAGDSTSIFYSVEVLQSRTGFEVGKNNVLFSLDRHFFAGSGPGNVVDLSPGGKQFVTLLLPPKADREADQAQVNVVLNWFAELRQRVPLN